MAYNRLSNYATTVFSDNGMTQVVYHSTVIVKWDNEKIILNSNGYETVTTKKKMNQASYQFNLGYHVWQKDWTWYVDWQDETLEYHDNMVLKR